MSAGLVEMAFREHHGSLVRMLGRRFGHEEGEDAVSFAFLQLHRHVDDVEAGDVGGWLYTTAFRYALSVRSLRGYQLLATSDVIDRLPDRRQPQAIDGDPAREVEARETVEAFGRLSRNQRRALLCLMLGLSYREATVACDRTYTWVNRHISEGRAALRKAVAA
jgi:DNA-directed RNA polymerase specialized sigma24 family protein